MAEEVKAHSNDGVSTADFELTESNITKTSVTPPVPLTIAKPEFAKKSGYKSAPRTTVKLTDLLKVAAKKDEVNTEAETKIEELNNFTPEDLQTVWKEFTEQRKKFQAEYQLLGQPYEHVENKIILHLLSPVQETMLDNIKTELTTYLRENLKNNGIVVEGKLAEDDDKKMMYTSRDKFEFLLDKNPLLREMKERLGLDSDF